MRQVDHLLGTEELMASYEADLERLKRYRNLREDLKRRLERHQVFELLGLKNERKEIEVALHYIERQLVFMETIEHRYAQLQQKQMN
ncbi:hypothetical protein [Thermicanus aegyptius]|uniref:hypothetical protein n=1 Tax=Thermicanus aegyptius TaxID=94009 RepID=UPI000414DCDA|nr:hypothetical protein [Thermicanus aegyptius]